MAEPQHKPMLTVTFTCKPMRVSPYGDRDKAWPGSATMPLTATVRGTTWQNPHRKCTAEHAISCICGPAQGWGHATVAMDHEAQGQWPGNMHD